MSAAWGDYDGDGLLDLYVTNYMECTGEWTTEAEIIANVGYHDDVLYHNEGDGTFTDVTAALPESDRPAAGFTAAWIDADSDGLLDLYLANDFVGPSPDHNRLWHNTGGDGPAWTFADVSLQSGAGLYMNTMGVGIGDVDRDGDFDLALSNIGGNKLLLSNGDGSFLEQAGSGIERPMQGVDYLTVTWGTAVVDFDLDGWDDVFMAAGNLPQGPEAVVGDQPNMLFLNDGTGESVPRRERAHGYRRHRRVEGRGRGRLRRRRRARSVRRRPGRRTAPVSQRHGTRGPPLARARPRRYRLER